ncbi:MAG TPA: tetratricopeptide repeat protein, partial [Flavobacteriales bacterium]|nr:tetratricopeptide repeat protein [Flavobacteriales bacterium]
MIRTASLLMVLATWCATLSARAQTASTKTADPAIDDLFHQGEVAYNSGAYAKAIGLFDQVLAKDPEHLNAYLQRGFCHGLQHEYEAAVVDFSAVIQRKSD